MRIGLLTDIHEEADALAVALSALAAAGADVVVQIGDACDLFGPGRGTGRVAAMLAAAGVVGVWGNHDVGFCHEVPDDVRARAEPHVLAYMAGMRGRLEVGGCHFSHADPHLDPHDPPQIWLASTPPDTPERAAPSFAAVPHRVAFIGHYHRWLVTTPAGRVAWAASAPLRLDPAVRHLVVVGPLAAGQFGLYDTDASTLHPFRCAARGPS